MEAKSNGVVIFRFGDSKREARADFGAIAETSMAS
jgi:hypothetical protein